MIKIRKILSLVMIISVNIFLLSCHKKLEIKIINHQGKYGITINKKLEKITINDKEVELYQTTDKEIKLLYESYNLDNEFNNKVMINDYSYWLLASNNNQNEFISNELTVFGLLIKPTISVEIISGTNEYGAYDNFHLRNIYFKIGDVEVWPNEYPKEEYLNEVFKFGSPNLKTSYRSGYKNSETLTFSFPEELLKYYGAILNFEEETLHVETEKTYEFKNPSYVSLTTNLESITYNEAFKIEVSGDNLKDYEVYINDVKVKKELFLHPDSWASGNHNIKVIGINEFDFFKVLSYDIVLKDYIKEERLRTFEFYETGVNEEKSETLKLGVKKDYESGVTSPFSKYAIQNFKVNVNEYNDFLWEGSAPLNRTLTLEVFNHNKNVYEVVSVNKVTSLEPLKLGFNYENNNDWIKNGAIDLRIVSFNNTQLSYDNYLYHVTDLQYITRKANSPEGVSKREGVKALNDVRDYLNASYQDNLLYTMVTGDQIQSIMNEGEHETFIEEFFTGIISEEKPLGVLTGNHDVGGTSDFNPDGADGFDEALSYELYGNQLGENVFNSYSWYGGSYKNNRSHYDLITINNETYVFLYLGWGSDQKSIHVSSQDVNYAKTVLSEHSDKKVILLAHEYLNNRGGRTATGNYLFNELVKPYKNILLVFCGHINGTTYKIDYLDDDNDGIEERRVLQSLTNFQEEENLNGASFIRKLGLDFKNNKIGFELFSPYYNDNDIFVIHHPNIVKRDKYFTYDFDFNNLGYGLITYGVK